MTQISDAARLSTENALSVPSASDTPQDGSADTPARRRTRPGGHARTDGAWSAADYRRRLRRAKKHVAKQQAAIQRAADDDQCQRVRSLRNLLLRSFDAKLVATHEGNRKMPRHRRRPQEELPHVAARLNPWRGTQEAVAVFGQPKDYGEFRNVMAFGLVNKALQNLVVLATTPLLSTNTNANQYSLAGRGGRDAACAAVVEAIREGGCLWAIKIDIKQCYPSLGGRKIPRLLPLPKTVTNHTILARNLNLVPRTHTNTILTTYHHTTLDRSNLGRNELPQGSAASPLMVEILLAEILDLLPETVACPTFADDIMVLTKTRSEAAAIASTLRVALQHHRAGPLRSKHPIRPRRVADGFDFLGYHFRRRRGRLYVHPKQKNMDGPDRIIISGFAKGHDLEDVCGRIRNWARNFPLWEDADDFASARQLAAARYYQDHQTPPDA